MTLQKFLVNQITNNVCKSQRYLMKFDEQFRKITIKVGFLHEDRKIISHPTKFPDSF